MTRSSSGPLAAASQRLRGKPGRPRKGDLGPGEGLAPADSGGKTVREIKPMAQIFVAPRLLTLEATAAYLGLSPWTVRELEAVGVLRRVSVPLPGGRELRKLLFDKADLDRLIEAWK